MKKLLIPLGVVAAILVHAAIILFGGILFNSEPKEKKVQAVDLTSEADMKAKDKEEKKEEKPEKQEEIKPEEPPPQAVAMEQSASPEPAKLDAVSLSALADALSGAAGDSSFGGSLSLKGGGVIGGKGKGGGGAGGVQSGSEDAFNAADIDQKPRAVFQVAPSYPAELRASKTVGEVLLILVVDANGKVSKVQVEKTSHPAFAKPATDAVKQWKFDPAIRGGKKVACRMRLPIKFKVG